MEVEDEWNTGTQLGEGSRREELRTVNKTNLEILLSQNDIVPLLKKINKESKRGNGSISLKQYTNGGGKVRKCFNNTKIRIRMPKNLTQD